MYRYISACAKTNYLTRITGKKVNVHRLHLKEKARRLVSSILGNLSETNR